MTGLMAALQRGQPGETYLFGGRCEMRNLDLAHMICASARRLADRATTARPMRGRSALSWTGRDTIFATAIDPSHAEDVLGWTANRALETGLAKTIDWYLANPDWLIPANELGRLGTRTAEVIRATS